MSQAATERRQADRYPVALPISCGAVGGTTRDVSVEGAFFETEAPVAVGERMRFALRSFGGPVAEGVEAHFDGVIVRIEPRGDGQKIGVAVAFERFVLGTPRSLAHSPSSDAAPISHPPAAAPCPAITEPAS